MATPNELLTEALTHHRAGRLQEAERHYRAVLAIDPQQPDALHLLGLVAHQVGQHAAAVSLMGEAIKRAGNVAAYHNNLGEAHRSLGHFNEAAASYKRAIALDARFAEAHNNLGTIYQNQGSLDEALACYERAIALQGDYVNARYNRARAWLALGDFAQGWKEYEWRWRRAEFARQIVDKPEWDGTPLAGRTLLVRWEQGLGDTLQFARYLKVLENARERVVASVQPSLVDLLRESGFNNLVPSDEPLPSFDVHAMLLSLPHLLGTALATIPAEVPYLFSPPLLEEQWKHELDAQQVLKVGIAWQGNPKYPLDHLRSIPLAHFAPLADVPGVRLYSLQVGPGREQLEGFANRASIVDLADRIGDFSDTAAIMRNLDLVIVSDSAAAHLAGALGVEVWVLLSTAADFRWLCERSDCPWYPTMRLFRQQKLGEWIDVFREVRSALDERLLTAADRRKG